MATGFKVLAFVGPAGTGKSQRAHFIARQFGADYIIDDGLLIKNGKILCGKSAKTEQNQVRAIRRALFEFSDHRDQVVKVLEKSAPGTILIVATSPGMALKISKQLSLPNPERYIYIEEIATREEIEQALRERHVKRQHVIPVTYVQVRRNFAGKVVGRLRTFWSSHMRGSDDAEKTIVRPPFSYYGEVEIGPLAIEQIVRRVASLGAQVCEVKEVRVKSDNDGRVSLNVSLVVSIGKYKFIEVGRRVQRRIFSVLPFLTGLDLGEIDILIEGWRKSDV
ncbi:MULTISPECIES: hypothetical protein [unclassified Acetomicrobium]|uniref:hypothetical protein n=1 Tax=unclassified Acetomicrobium TaxID=2627317 RepID=UPI001BCCCFC9|nr:MULTISPECIES: hypothetical protein [Acetomicrobium]